MCRVIVDNALYRDGHRVQLGCDVDDIGAVGDELRGEHDFVWVGLHEPTAEELEIVRLSYALHPLAVEDALTAHQRPKAEHFDGSLFLVLKTLWYVDEQDAVETGEISMFVGKQFVVTVRHGEGSSLRDARAALEANETLLSHGPAAVVHAVIDDVVDRYEQVANELVEDVDEVETSVFSDERTRDSARIYVLKRELAEMRRAVLPLRAPLDRFARGDSPLVSNEAAPYFRDITDHLARVADTIDSLDGLLSTAFDAHLAQISIQQNEDMRTISATVGLVAAPTLVAGIYGMNFDNMPELHWTFGYPMALGLMLLSSLTVWVISKRAGWL